MTMAKTCSKCGGEYPLAFFRANSKSSGCTRKTGRWHRAICIGCQQYAGDASKRANRFRQKAITSIRRHATKYEMAPAAFRATYGWAVDKVERLLRHASKAGCHFCGNRFLGFSDLQIDIIDPKGCPPYFSTNVGTACATCNRAKQEMSREDWAERLIAHEQWKDRRAAIDAGRITGLPLWDSGGLLF